MNEAFVEFVYGDVVQSRPLNALKLEPLPLWGEFKEVVVLPSHIIHRLSSFPAALESMGLTKILLWRWQQDWLK